MISSATLTLPPNFEVVGKIGYEDYLQNHLPSYTWYETGINYNWGDHIVLGVRGLANNLSAEDCLAQTYTDCANAVFATLTLRGKLSDAHK